MVPDKLEWQVRAVELYKDVCGACITDARLVTDSGLDTTSFREAGKSYAQEIGLAENAIANLARYLEARSYEKAREALSPGTRIDPTGPLTLKWLLARIAPFFARRLVPKTRAYTAQRKSDQRIRSIARAAVPAIDSPDRSYGRCFKNVQLN